MRKYNVCSLLLNHKLSIYWTKLNEHIKQSNKYLKNSNKSKISIINNKLLKNNKEKNLIINISFQNIYINEIGNAQKKGKERNILSKQECNPKKLVLEIVQNYQKEIDSKLNNIIT